MSAVVEDNSGVPAKKRATRRGFSKKASQTSVTEKTQHSSAIYSSRVTNCFAGIKAHGFEDDLSRDDSLKNEDVEDDLLTTCSMTKLPEIEEFSTYTIPDEEENSQNIQNTSVTEAVRSDALSPPPPPSPPSNQKNKKKRGKRAPKGKKMLLSAANDLNEQMMETRYQLTASSVLMSPAPEVYVVDSNDELTVRLELMGNIQRFCINAEEPFSTIISQIGAQENVQDSCVMMVHNDKTLRPTDTPLSVNLHMADIIKCHIVKNAGDAMDESFSQDSLVNSKIEIVVQCQTSRRPEHVKACVDQPLSVVMREYAQRVNKDKSMLQFFFDGDVVEATQTPSDLDMEDGDILDVKEQQVILLT